MPKAVEVFSSNTSEILRAFDFADDSNGKNVMSEDSILTGVMIARVLSKRNARRLKILTNLRIAFTLGLVVVGRKLFAGTLMLIPDV